MTYRYRTTIRPTDSTTLPPGLSWWWAELPHDFRGHRPDLRTSKHRYGVFETTVPIAEGDLLNFDLEAVPWAS